METALQAFAEPNRRRILELLIESDELSSGEIASHFRLTPSAVSQHLGVLEQARLVSIRRDGTRRLYRLRGEGFRELCVYLERFWAQGLERLKMAAEGEARGGRRPGSDRSRSHQPRRRYAERSQH